MAGRSISIICVATILLCLAIRASSQTQTTGRIAGTVKDAQGAVIARAEVVVQNLATADKRATSTDGAGNYSVSALAPGSYQVKVQAHGFSPALFQNVVVGLAETTAINASLTVAQSSPQI